MSCICICIAPCYRSFFFVRVIKSESINLTRSQRTALETGLCQSGSVFPLSFCRKSVTIILPFTFCHITRSSICCITENFLIVIITRCSSHHFAQGITPNNDIIPVYHCYRLICALFCRRFTAPSVSAFLSRILKNIAALFCIIADNVP